MKLSNIKIGLLFLLILFVQSAFATTPVATLENVADQMLTYLQRNQSQLARNPKIIHHIVDRVLVPHIDVDRMAGAVIGRRYWEKATPAQRKAFITEFKYLVVSTYSAALASYDDDTIRFYPLRKHSIHQKRVRVRSVIIRKSGQRIPISYNLVKNNNRWEVYDFSVEGISMVQSYHSQFASLLARGGMPALLKRLAAHNRRHGR